VGFFDESKQIAGIVKQVAGVKDRDELLSFVRRAEEIHDEKLALERRCRELEEVLRFKEQVRFERNAYWAEGDPHPYCSGCFDGTRKDVRLIQQGQRGYYQCPVCKSDSYTGDGRNDHDEEPPLRGTRHIQW